ncbi:hypothetical protein D187_004462 [Cystobacter fuscus DSM 2262]|uniref:Uncharacterized protein n=1 Tax=Cystobacter fuscus (strain ATCC 25194 / DSM 2262 / NBRC 100088 / M29) TaxID=1242864 RepID=S9QN04_CYSF2|nr:hypothetical protein D187_004462 [Cystobacter fuscus DSM 2262]
MLVGLRRPCRRGCDRHALLLAGPGQGRRRTQGAGSLPLPAWREGACPPGCQERFPCPSAGLHRGTAVRRRGKD